MNRIDRLFGMLTLLQSRKYVPAELLAEKFDISIRTVYRDVKALGESGIPVSFEPQKGYCIMPGFFLPPVSFTTEEASALLLIEAIVEGFADKSIRDRYDGVLTKVKSVLRGQQKDAIEALTRRIRLQVPACIMQDGEYLTVLQQAISGRQILEVDYKNKAEVVSRRQVEPIGLIFYALGWHLIAWCHLRGAYRDFKVQRILKVRNTGRSFTRTDHIELTEYMQELPVDF